MINLALFLFVLGAGQNLNLCNANVKQDQSEKLFTVNLASDLIELPEVPRVVEMENPWILDDNASALVMALPEEIEDDLAELRAAEAEDEPDIEDSDDEDEENSEPNQSQKRGRTPKKSNKKQKKPELRFDDIEIFDPAEWISRRRSQITTVDKDALQSDVNVWNDEFRKYHQMARDGQQSVLRTTGVVGNFVKVIAAANPNNHDTKVLKLFAKDRTLHRMHHMKVQLKTYMREKNRKESSRSKNLKNHLAE